MRIRTHFQNSVWSRFVLKEYHTRSNIACCEGTFYAKNAARRLLQILAETLQVTAVNKILLLLTHLSQISMKHNSIHKKKLKVGFALRQRGKSPNDNDMCQKISNA